jgi:hypothetical protein
MAFKTKEFKLIVAGGRDFSDYETLSDELNNLAYNEYADREVSIVSGMAPGADSLAVQFAREVSVQLHRFPADWSHYGKRAGFIRNTQMAEFADGLLAFWDGESRGTAHMIETMKKLKKPVHIVRY